MKLPFFTIGHSNRSLEAFLELLHEADVSLVADIRKIPQSRSNPQFNEDALRDSLRSCDLAYEHVAALGGLRGKARTVSREVNGFWTHQSFHNYADYALSNDFRAGLEHLIQQGRQRRCVIMCSEAVWWRCHRRIVTDHLLANGEAVFHIMAQGRVVPASLTPGAVIQTDGTVIYPSEHARRRRASSPIGPRRS